MEKTLSELFPILEVSEGCILTKTGDYTLAYELTKPEIFTLSGEGFQALHQAWIKAIHVLPVGSVIHAQDWYTTDAYHSDFEGTDPSFLTRASESFFHERPYLDHRAYLFLTKRPAGHPASDRAFTGLLKKRLVPEELLQPPAIQEFFDQAGQFERILSDSGFIRLRRLSNMELTGDAGAPGVIERYCQLTEKKLPVTRDIQLFTTNGVRIGDYQGLLYTLADAEHLPGQCSAQRVHTPYSTERTPFPIGFATALGPLLNCNHVYNQYIFIIDPVPTRQKLELKERRMQSLSSHSRENSLGKEAIHQFLDEALEGQRQLVSAHFNVFAWAEDPAIIKECRKTIPSAISHMGAVPHLKTFCAGGIWWAGIPGNAAALPDYECFLTFTEQATCFFVPETNYRSSISPTGLRLGDRITGRPVHVDLSDEVMASGVVSNRNKLICSSSGSGKSFFCNHFLRSYYEQGGHIVVVDIGHSYKGLCQFLDGHYFTYSEKAPISFNPFWLAEGDVLDIEKKEAIKNLLFTLWKKDDEQFFRSEYVALSNALQAYYEYLSFNKDVFPCFDTFYQFLRDQFAPTLAGEGIKEKHFDIDNFLYVLKPFCLAGEYGYLLNARENLDLLHQRFVVFELDSIKDNPTLFGATIVILMDVFISKMRKLPGIRKILVLEEVWKLLTKKGTEEAAQYYVKTIRKFFGELVVVTQEVEDLISSAIVKKAIINNCDCKILLDQSKFQNRFDDIQQLLGLTEHDKELVLSINKSNEPGRKYKEVFITFGNGHSKVYRTEVSLEEYLTYTTEESEKVKVEAYAARYGSYRKGVARLAQEMREKR